MKHVIDNFEYYNCGDLHNETDASLISGLRDALEFPFDESLEATDALAIVRVRIKQAEFKANLFNYWQGCSLRSIDIDPRYLIASHIKPWARSSDRERVLAANGLLLPPNYDYLFDRHLISFDDDGNLLFANPMPPFLASLIKAMGVKPNVSLKCMDMEMVGFMREHREEFVLVTDAMSNITIEADT